MVCQTLDKFANLRWISGKFCEPLKGHDSEVDLTLVSLVLEVSELKILLLIVQNSGFTISPNEVQIKVLYALNISNNLK